MIAPYIPPRSLFQLPLLSTPSVRHRAIEVHRYYYYIKSLLHQSLLGFWPTHVQWTLLSSMHIPNRFFSAVCLSWLHERDAPMSSSEDETGVKLIFTIIIIIIVREEWKWRVLGYRRKLKSQTTEISLCHCLKSMRNLFVQGSMNI